MRAREDRRNRSPPKHSIVRKRPEMEDARPPAKDAVPIPVGPQPGLQDTSCVSTALNPVRVSIEEYLDTSYRPDCDYVNGEVQERNFGEKDQDRKSVV